MKAYFKYIAIIILAASILISAIIISNSVPTSFQINGYPAYQSGGLGEETEIQERDYLSLYEVGVYLNLTEDEVMTLIQSGNLDHTYIYVDGGYVFSRAKLAEAIDSMMAE